jgi:hypothetical protein
MRSCAAFVFLYCRWGSLEVSGRSSRWDAPQPSGADWMVVIVLDDVAVYLSHPKIDPTTQVFWLMWRNG